MDTKNLKVMHLEVKPENKIKIHSTSVPDDRPDFHTWCRELNVSTLHNRADHWLDFEIDRPALYKELNAVK